MRRIKTHLFLCRRVKTRAAGDTTTQHDDGDGWHNNGKGQHGDMRHDDGTMTQHDDGDGRHNNGKRQHGDMRHDNGERQQHGDEWHDDAAK